MFSRFKKNKTVKPGLTEGQEVALKLLKSPDNVFLTGSAGTGKSFVIREYLKSLEKPPPILASTGAAAVLVGGRTFHSYFGLGIMEGGLEKTVSRALNSDRVWRRIGKDKAIIIDEISMIHPDAFEAANRIAQKVKYNKSPFGGLRVIVVGDFLQLPPVDRYEKKLPWLFESSIWSQLEFQTVELTKSMRTSNQGFIDLLNQVRVGNVSKEVSAFLDSRISELSEDFEGTVLFGRRAQAEAYNMAQLEKIDKKLEEIKTEVKKAAKVKKSEENLIAMTPLPEVLAIKPTALVMIRKNDPNFEFVNGTLARVVTIKPELISVKLLDGRQVNLAKEDFQVLDADGKVSATIRNFPLTLAWATTIHKSQGASIDRIHVDLKGLWECGQAYVAISRAKSPDGLFIEGWGPESIKADTEVVSFYSNN